MNIPSTDGTIQLRCPECGRHLAHCGEFGQAVCSNCGCRVTYEGRAWRRKQSTTPNATPTLAATTT